MKIGLYAFIWDLDGTLLDSYEVIVSSLHKTCREFGVPADEEGILREVITHTVSDFITKVERESGVNGALFKRRYSEINDANKFKIKPIPMAAETLQGIRELGIPNFVFTHRGISTEAVLKNTGLFDFFVEIVTGKDGFGRKPDPGAILYLLDKYGLDRECTCYVGDRTLDIDCACNAGIHGILYLPDGSVTVPNGKETLTVRELPEILRIIQERACQGKTLKSCSMP